jgi:PKD repeat protein
MKRIAFALAVITAGALAGSACTVHQTEAPGLTGPSEFALSLAMTASPDSITQDGRSNSTVTIVARDVNGSALANVPFRLDMHVDGEAADYGTLSTRNVVTGSDGRATVVYTAPPAPLPGSSAGFCSGGFATTGSVGRCVEIVATAIGSDYSTAQSRSVLIHLIQTGIIVPASATPSPAFTVAPTAPTANESVQFDASKSCASSLDGSGACGSSSGTITSYQWNFGDGATASGKLASHAFARQQTYLVTLTITNDVGLTASTTQSVQVGAGVVPKPAFISSPTSPAPGTAVNFDATTSNAGAGHSIVRFVWNWGDGTAATDSSSPVASHTYAAAGTYVVSLTVADEAGQTASVTGQVTVAVP